MLPQKFHTHNTKQKEVILMKLNFIKANPCENMTIFILDPLPREMYPEISKKLMDYNNIHAEQVGFIERPTLSGSCSRLHMMGGEFCGNATRAFAAIMVQKGYSPFEFKDGKHIVPLEASGIEQVLYSEVKQLTDHSFDVKVKIPVCKSISPFEINHGNINFSGFIVEFDGISHFVVFSDQEKYGEEVLNEAVRKLSPLKCGAFGIMFYNKEKDFMTPLVYVENTKSMVWERGCGTGTAALGAVLSYTTGGSIIKEVFQPGGKIEVITSASKEHISEIYLKGNVSIVAEGEVYI